MNKLVKGAIATAAGVALLMGGAGTLAYWNGTAQVSGATISAGELKVVAATPANATWKNGSTTVNPATFKAVPGDVLTFTQDVTISATGNNLKFTAGVSNNPVAPASSSAADVALAAEINKTATYSVDSTKLTQTGANTNTYTVATAGTSTATVTVTVTWPFGANVANASQLGSVVVQPTGVTLTQVQ